MTTIAEARDRDSAFIIHLFTITPQNSGADCLFATRNIAIDRGVGGVDYFQDFIIEATGIGSEIKRETSGSTNYTAKIIFKNDPFRGYDYLSDMEAYYPFTGADVVVEEVYVVNGVPSDPETILVGKLDSPDDIGLKTFACTLSNKSKAAAEEYLQPKINSTDFPGAIETLGIEIPYLIGAEKLVPTLWVDRGANSTLVDAIDATQTTGIKISIKDYFDGSGSIYADTEQISYTSIGSDGTLSGVTRNVNGLADAHRAGAEVWQYQTQYDALICEGELYSSGDIYALHQGTLRRVTSGASVVLSSGRQLVRATQQITLDAIDVSGDTTSTYPPSDRQVSRRCSNLPEQEYNPSYLQMTFPAAPSGTLGEIKVKFSWDVIVLANPSSTVTLYAGDSTQPKICQVSTSGVITRFIEGDVEMSKSAWVTYQNLSIGNYSSNVIFSFADAEETAKVTSAFSGDSDGAEVRSPATNMPEQQTTATSMQLTFPSAPSGTLTEKRIRFNWSVDVQSGSRTNDIHFYAGDSSQKKICTVKTSGAIIQYLPNTVEIALSSWTTNKLLTISNGHSSVTWTISTAEEIARTDAENSLTTVDVTVGGIATRNVEQFFVKANGDKDPDGNYGGSGNLIERPDYVMKYFIVKIWKKFSLSEIDATSFSAAGTAFASAGYKLSFRLDRITDPLKTLQDMAFQSGAIIYFDAGKWYLDIKPGTAPAADKTIDYQKLGGRKDEFTFTWTDRADIENDLEAVFAESFGVPGFPAWGGESYDSDATSITKFGTYPKRYEFQYIRDQDTADGVLATIKAEKKVPRLLVDFNVTWRDFDLIPGSTFDITNPIFNAKKFFVEKVKRKNPFINAIKGREWY